MRYRKKSVEVEAFQFDGDMMTSDGKYYVPDWAVAALNDELLFFKNNGDLYIKDYLGDTYVPENNYIIRVIDYDGRFKEYTSRLYTCSPDIFEELYEPIEG